ncbi:preprotein translocase subunit SecG [Jannaschia donghaensis]|uniref:Protein-export membrane protein SecG n=1 Tax=Jannaschia donghaensis TaxID=420998 RepID=A0A0M6YGP5_9RHOB|nr:preprotein translocase subunit SecG [Jannaschia donghaensis]CTQ48437.1 Preprotein translocase band 1 subunit [Jannaschia donghaensis]
MENVILVVHLILALTLIGIVLMQRSEGGGLGMGGGGGAATGRAAATGMTKLTWVLAVGFLITSITLTIVAAQNASGTSILDDESLLPPTAEGTAPVPPIPSGENLIPPSVDGAPATPPRSD